MNLEIIMKMIEENGGRIFKDKRCIGDHFREVKQSCDGCLINEYKKELIGHHRNSVDLFSYQNFCCSGHYKELVEIMRKDLRKQRLRRLLEHS